mmetsp:Transcript_113614/g.328084  ORF Transcript_113614/g.328084 Transcript_113614/m.328084 type:complete len:288 (+) Transcript_113614:856-1719(+)
MRHRIRQPLRVEHHRLAQAVLVEEHDVSATVQELQAWTHLVLAHADRRGHVLHPCEGEHEGRGHGQNPIVAVGALGALLKFLPQLHPSQRMLLAKDAAARQCIRNFPVDAPTQLGDSLVDMRMRIVHRKEAEVFGCVDHHLLLDAGNTLHQAFDLLLNAAVHLLLPGFDLVGVSAHDDHDSVRRMNMDGAEPESQCLERRLERLILLAAGRAVQVLPQPSVEAGDHQVDAAIREEQVVHHVVLALPSEVPGLQQNLLGVIPGLLALFVHQLQNHVARHLRNCGAEIC